MLLSFTAAGGPFQPLPRLAVPAIAALIPFLVWSCTDSLCFVEVWSHLAVLQLSLGLGGADAGANCPGAFLSKKCTPFIWHSGTVCYWEHTGMGRGLSSPVRGATGTHFLFAPVEEKGLGAPPWGHDGTSARAMDSPHPGSCSPQALPLGLLHSTPSVGSGCCMHSVLFCTLQQHTDPKDKMGN